MTATYYLTFNMLLLVLLSIYGVNNDAINPVITSGKFRDNLPMLSLCQTQGLSGYNIYLFRADPLL